MPRQRPKFLREEEDGVPWNAFRRAEELTTCAHENLGTDGADALQAFFGAVAWWRAKSEVRPSKLTHSLAPVGRPPHFATPRD